MHPLGRMGRPPSPYAGVFRNRPRVFDEALQELRVGTNDAYPALATIWRLGVRTTSFTRTQTRRDPWLRLASAAAWLAAAAIAAPAPPLCSVCPLLLARARCLKKLALCLLHHLAGLHLLRLPTSSCSFPSRSLSLSSPWQQSCPRRLSFTTRVREVQSPLVSVQNNLLQLQPPPAPQPPCPLISQLSPSLPLVRLALPCILKSWVAAMRSCLSAAPL